MNTFAVIKHEVLARKDWQSMQRQACACSGNREEQF